MKFLKFAFVFTLITLSQGTIEAQEWVSYQTQEQVNDLVDVNNELHMATDVGLVVMNKSTLEKTILTAGNSNLPSNHIQAVVEAADGSIWIGTYDLEVAQFDGNDFIEITIPASLIANPVTAKLYDIEFAPNGDLWIGTSEAVLHKQGNNWFRYDEDDLDENLFEVWDIEIDENGIVYAGSIYMYKFESGVWTNILETTPLVGYLHTTMFFSSTGDMYFAGDLDSIGRYDGQNWETFYNGGLNGSQIKGFAEDTNGAVYYQTQYNGIFKLVGDTWIGEAGADLMAFDNKIDYLHIDDQNTRWLNSGIYLSANDNGNIQSTLIAETTLEDSNTRNLHKGNNGNMYFITSSKDNISVVNPNGDWSFLPLPASLPPFAFLNDLLVLSDNDIWLATGNGLYQYDGSSWVTAASGIYNSLSTDSQGKIYSQTIDKISIIENGVISEYNSSNSPLTTNHITGHGVDSNDNLWISEGDINDQAEIAMIHQVAPDGTWTSYSETDHPIINEPFGDFHFDSMGNVWIKSDDVSTQVIKFNGTTFSGPYIGNFLEMANYNVNSITSSADGTMYFSHQYGVTTLLNGVWGNLLINDQDVPNTNNSTNSEIVFDDAGNLWWASSVYGVFAYTMPLDGFELSIKVFLEGSYDNDGAMNSALTDLIPATQPYNVSPWFYNGNENLSTISNDMVDWVLVEARSGTPSLSGNAGTSVVETQAGILLQNGDIVGSDGAALRFLNLTANESYHFAIRHRNHLSVLATNPTMASPQMNYDFTTAIDMAFGAQQQKLTTDGKAVMYAGDANADNVIQVTDFDMWVEEPAALEVYQSTDFNLDGVIQVTDYDKWFDNKAKLGIVEF